jgi:hypothetical protein
MNACACGKTASPSLARRCAEVAGWVAPGALLAVMPKCPMCFAAYLALGTGIGISAAAAEHLRTGLIVLCVASLVYFSVRCLRRLLQSRTGQRR